MALYNVLRVTGRLLMFLGCFFLCPALLAEIDGESNVAFLESFAITCATGGLFMFFSRGVKLRFSAKDGFAVVLAGWFFLCIFGSLPYVLMRGNGAALNWPDAIFETMSGLTTTGASILSDVEALPRSLLLWRSMTHWLGGMGIIVLFLAVLPMLGAGGFQLYRAEMPGPSKDKLAPKIGSTAKKLWAVYVGITIVLFILLWLCGMNWFDSLVHTFGTVATGGFSNKNESVAAFKSWKIDLVLTIFMFVCGCNFALLLNVIRGHFTDLFRNDEFKIYLGITLVSIFIITILNATHPTHGEVTWLRSLQVSAFQVVTIMTTTGFATDDYDLWPKSCQLVLLMLMFIGGCAGSTSGGLKVFRFLIVLKVGVREIVQLLRPRAILSIRVDGQSLDEALLRVVLGFVCLFFLTFCFFTLLIIWIEGDSFSVESLLAISISCLSNVGPGLAELGPTDNYQALKDATKLILSFMMFMGRLEIYSVLVMLHRDFWRR